jgi:D-alanyl-D-alanine carboxypeptidase/D-alanyl-D-alanine-endopeptidase (penicillin-binding protein 4)
MQNANRITFFAFCLVHVAFLSCAKKLPSPPAPELPRPIDPIVQLGLDIDALVDQPGHRHGIWGIVVHSLARDARLYERNSRTLLVPASTMKLVSLAAAAEAVGWDWMFETQMLAAGPVIDGVLKGDLVITGSGDPSFLGRPGGGAFGPWIDALRAKGITRVDGRVVADDDALEEPEPGFAWSWEDLGYAYGAIPGALNFAENTLDILVSPAALEGLPATIELPAEARDLPVINAARTGPPGTRTTLWPEFRPGALSLTLNGTIAVGDKPVAVSVAAGNPTEWFARAVRNRVLAAGIDVPGGAIDADDLPVRPDWSGATLLHEHRSPRLAEIAKPLLKDSINLYAEAVLRLATGPSGARTADAGLDAVRARLESWRIPKEWIQIVDGSGLSRRNVVAPEALAAILTRFYDDSGASPFMQAQAIAGRDGTLASRMKGTPAEGNALGKTGSMSNVRTLAGYVKTGDGEPLAFAIMANNFEGPASGVTATIDRLVTRLASFSRTRPATPPPPAHIDTAPSIAARADSTIRFTSPSSPPP